MPKRYENASLLDIFDDLKVSMRYVHYYTGQPDPIVVTYSEQVKIHRQFRATDGIVVYETPYGELVERYKLTTDESWRKTEFPVKSVDDLRKLRWLYANTTYSFSVENFLKAASLWVNGASLNFGSLKAHTKPLPKFG